MPEYYTKSSGVCAISLGSINLDETRFMIFGNPVLLSMIAIFDKEN
jgi:hypothetical protein